MSEAIQRYIATEVETTEGGREVQLIRAPFGDIVTTRDHLAAVAKLEAEHNKELARWQHDIYNYLCCVIGEPLYRIDGACDSGDPLDFTLMEIKQCVEILKENAEAENAVLREQLARMQAPVSDALREAAITACLLCAGGNKFVETIPRLEEQHSKDHCKWFHRYADTGEIASICTAFKIHDLIAARTTAPQSKEEPNE